MDEATPGTPTASDVARVHAVAREVFDVVGTKWALPVIEAIGTDSRRFGELHRQVAGISHRVLTVTLRQLERNGVVDRMVHPTVPPRTEYRLTLAGRDLHGTINGFCHWSRRHLDEVLAARRRFERS
ncbi:winged helix-turn-helix transcriptional regulator [Micromonospora olivasterospora]|uniref:HxlR family transcriptional regulator n=1 Tax=Micromonospora olivasterospora TaxID=1880 RepID=A0A562I3H8_MICOL|nr:helix-turn-helix domain-containing protein [Micromonospora olivasterospora]TWH65356.1 HxlR family transcriptional regulator [Micromonospora olivasterospora]